MEQQQLELWLSWRPCLNHCTRPVQFYKMECVDLALSPDDPALKSWSQKGPSSGWSLHSWQMGRAAASCCRRRHRDNIGAVLCQQLASLHPYLNSVSFGSQSQSLATIKIKLPLLFNVFVVVIFNMCVLAAYVRASFASFHGGQKGA